MYVNVYCIMYNSTVGTQIYFFTATNRKSLPSIIARNTQTLFASPKKRTLKINAQCFPKLSPILDRFHEIPNICIPPGIRPHPPRQVRGNGSAKNFTSNAAHCGCCSMLRIALGGGNNKKARNNAINVCGGARLWDGQQITLSLSLNNIENTQTREHIFSLYLCWATLNRRRRRRKK